MGSLRPFLALAVVLAACGGNDAAAPSTVEIVLAEVSGRTVSLVFIANAEDIDRAEVDWGDGLVVRVDGDGRFAAEHTYANDGTYPVVATVFAAGGAARAAQTIEIREGATTTSSSTTDPEVTTSDPAATTTEPEVTTTGPSTTSAPRTLPPASSTTTSLAPSPTPPPATTAPPTTAPRVDAVAMTKSFEQRSSAVYQNSGPNGSSSGGSSGVNVYAKAAGVNETSVGLATVEWSFPVADFGWPEPRAIVSVYVDTSWLGILETSSSSGNAATISLDASGSVGGSLGSASDFRTLGPGSSQTYGITDPLGFGSVASLNPSSTITVTVVVRCTARGADTIFGVFGGSECDFSTGNRRVDLSVRVTLRPEG